MDETDHASQSDPPPIQHTMTATQGQQAGLTMVVQKALVAEPVKVTAQLTRAWDERVPKWLRISSGLKWAGRAAHTSGDFVVRHVPGIGVAAGVALEYLSGKARKRGVRPRRESS